MRKQELIDELNLEYQALKETCTTVKKCVKAHEQITECYQSKVKVLEKLIGWQMNYSPSLRCDMQLELEHLKGTGVRYRRAIADIYHNKMEERRNHNE